MLQLESFASRVAAFYRERGYQVTEQARVRGTSGNIYTVPMVADGPLGALLVSFGDAAGIDGPEVGRVRTMARDVGATPVLSAPRVEPAIRRLAAQMAVVVLEEEALGEPADATQVPLIALSEHRRDLDAHPWPASGRAHGTYDVGVTRAVDVDDMLADLVKRPASPAIPSPASSTQSAAQPFGWLAQAKKDAAAAGTLPTATPTAAPPAQIGPEGWLAALGSTPAPSPEANQAVLAPVARSEVTAIEYETVVAARMPVTRHMVRSALLWGALGAAALFALLWLFG